MKNHTFPDTQEIALSLIKFHSVLFDFDAGGVDLKKRIFRILMALNTHPLVGEHLLVHIFDAGLRVFPLDPMENFNQHDLWSSLKIGPEYTLRTMLLIRGVMQNLTGEQFAD